MSPPGQTSPAHTRAWIETFALPLRSPPMRLVARSHAGVDRNLLVAPKLAWLKKHPRFRVHFIPTSSSWLNLVERFFAEITGKRIRRGTFASVAELEEAIDEYLLRHNASAKPYRWTKPAADILARERRALDKLDAIKSRNQASDLEH